MVLLRIRWLQVLVAAVIVEVVLLGIAIPLNLSASGRAALLVLVIPLCTIGAFLGGWWAARRASGLHLMHGLLVGTVAALIYGLLTLKVNLPATYIIANYLKLPAGAIGGITAQWLGQRSSNSSV